MQAGQQTLRLVNGPTGPAWSDVSPLVADRYTRDPFIATDHVTGRTWVSNLVAECTNFALTDDAGASWIEHPRGCGPLTAIDHQSMASGPYHAAEPLATYPRAFYLCGNQVAGGACARSTDGGLTFGPGRAMYSLLECGGSHGQIRVGPTGLLAVPVRDCGGANTVAVSRDGGASFERYPLPASVSEKESDPAVAFDANGTLYAAYVDDAPDGSVLRFTRSSNGGAGWSAPLDIGGRFGIRNVQFPVVLAGDGGRAVVAFLGSQTPGDDQADAFGGVWHAYVALTVNGGNHWTVSNPDPTNILQRGCVNLGGVTQTRCRNLLDFVGIDVDRTGAIHAVVADGCDAACEDGVGPSTGARLTLLRQKGGPKLFVQDRDTVPGHVFPRAAGRDSAVDVAWTAADGNGRAVTAYRVFRSLTAETEAAVEIARVGAGERSYRDTDVRAGVPYFYSVAAENGNGLGRRLSAAEAVAFVTDTVDATRGSIATDGTAVADGTDPMAVTVTVRDRNGNPIGNHPIRLTAGPATVSPTTAVRTDQDGKAAFTLRTTRAGNHALRAYTDGTSDLAAPEATAAFVPGPVDAARSVSTRSRPKAAADGTTPIDVGVRLLDAHDNPVSGVEVGLRLSPGAAAVVSPGTVVSDATGWVSLPVTSAVQENISAQPVLVAGSRDVTSAQALSFVYVPSPPPGVSATPGDANVRVSWGQPGGTAPSHYYLFRDGNYLTTVTAPTTTYLDTSRTNGTTYQYEVASYTTYVGQSSRSPKVYATPLGVPAMPTGFTAAPGNGVVTVSWTASPSTTGTPVSGYRIYVDGAYRTSTTGTSTLVTGLANGVTYRLSVAAYNAVWESSRPFADATPVAPPAAPTGLSGQPGDGTVSLSWTASPSSGAAPVAGYRIWVDGVARATTAATTYPVTGLANGTSYVIAVTAYNGSGDSAAPSVTVTPVKIPAMPVGLVATPGNAAVSLSWTAVSSTAASPVAGYRVYLDGVLRTSVTTNAATISGLTDGQTYAFRVSAYNVAGESAQAPAVSATPRPVPNVPTGLSATAGDAQVSLSWTVPASGTAPTAYRVYRDGALAGTAAGTSYVDTGRTNGVTYTYTVSSYATYYGESARTGSVTATPVAPPGVPTGFAATPANTSVSLSWTAPSSSAANPVGGYRVYVDGALHSTVASTSTTTRIPFLTQNQTYSFQVSAYNGTGESARTTAATATPRRRRTRLPAIRSSRPTRP